MFSYLLNRWRRKNVYINKSGISYCLSGKRLVWWPRSSEAKDFNDFGLSNSIGVSSFLSDKAQNLDEIIQFSGQENLTLFLLVLLCLNPSELSKPFVIEFI